MAKTSAAKIRGIFEKEPGSGVWWVQWFDVRGKRRREKAGTKAAAIKLKAKRTTDKLEARKIPETLKFKAGAKFWELCGDAQVEAEHENGRSAQRNLSGVIKALLPEFGDRQADSITTDELRTWLRRQETLKEWADGTCNHYVIQLCVMFRIGQEKEKVTENPARNLKRRPLDNDKPRYLKPDEAERLERLLTDHYPQHMEAYLFARNTGLRAGAQFHLKWTQIDMERRELTLPPKRNSKYKKYRVLPLNSVAYSVLIARKLRSGSKGLVFGEYHDGPAYLVQPAYWFPEICDAAEIEEFTWHSLRHDFASQLVMRGVNLKTVQELMCHANLKQTAKYAALAPTHLSASVESLTRAIDLSQTATENPSATKTATSVVDFPLSA